MLTDIIPDGTFHAGEYDEKRMAAIVLMEKLWEKIARDYPDLWLRIGEDYGEIAQWIFWLKFEENPILYRKAVWYAIRFLTDESARAPIRSQKARENLARIVWDRKTHNSMAAKARHEQWIWVDVNAMTLWRWLIPWSDKEKVRAFMLSLEMKAISGHPEYDKISALLNQEFHSSKNIRSSKTVADFVKWARVKDPKHPKYKLLFNTKHNIFSSEHLPEELSEWWVKFDTATWTVWISDNVPIEHRLFWARHEHTCVLKQDPRACSNATKKELQIIQEEGPDILTDYVTRRMIMMQWVLAFGQKYPEEISNLVREKLTMSLQILEKAHI